MRWNIVVGGQLFSKSLRGFTTYKIHFAGQEGLVVAVAISLVPFLILSVLLWLFNPWEPSEESAVAHE
jgi:predicted membrane protein